jgi:hypothetical protein
MSEWVKKNLITILLITGSWVFTIGYVKAETETRLSRLETDVAYVKDMMYDLQIITAKLEVITNRLERIVEDK